MKKILIVLILVFSLVACSKTNEDTKQKAKQEIQKEDKNKIKQGSGEKVKLNQVLGYQEGNIKGKIVTNMGDMEIILFPNVAPKAVENFVTHAKEGYYEGVIFHRVIEDFMIQGGDPTGTGRGGESIWGSPFEDEFNINYRHFTGALSMANAGPGTNGSQFFIVTAKDNISNNILGQMKEIGENGGYPESVVEAYKSIGGGTPHLDYKHTVFGQVVKGLEVAENISKVKTDSKDKPLKDVVIKKIIIED